MEKCNNQAVAMYRKDGSAIFKSCGTWFGGYVLFCSNCEKKMKEKYPQGWRSYPGDVCRHGRYVGGCGADLMCPLCEFGDD